LPLPLPPLPLSPPVPPPVAPPVPLPEAPPVAPVPLPEAPAVPALPDVPPPVAEPLLLPLLSLRIELVVALLVSDFDRIDAGLWSRTQSLIARPVRLAHSFGVSLCIVEPAGVVTSAGIVLLFVDCAPAVVAIASEIAAASISSFHVFIVRSLVSDWRRCNPAYTRVIAGFI